MRFFTKNSGGNRFVRRTASHVLPSFRSNYRDSAQTCPRRARFFARTLENEKPLTGTHIPTCRPWGWFSMDSREGARTVSVRRKGEEKCFTRRSNGADLFLTETPSLGAIEVFNGQVFEAPRAVVRIVRMKNRYLIHLRNRKFRLIDICRLRDTRSRLNIFHNFIFGIAEILILRAIARRVDDSDYIII